MDKCKNPFCYVLGHKPTPTYPEARPNMIIIGGTRPVYRCLRTWKVLV